MERPGVIEISTSTFGEREILNNLIIIMADPSDAGGYACNATNAAGQDSTAAELTVHGKWLLLKKKKTSNTMETPSKGHPEIRTPANFR